MFQSLRFWFSYRLRVVVDDDGEGDDVAAATAPAAPELVVIVRVAVGVQAGVLFEIPMNS